MTATESNVLFSIVMPVFNGAASVANSIKSIQAQTRGDWEVLVVDDCSTDNTATIVKSLAQEDPRIRYFRLPSNSRVAAARNEGLRQATGRYIAFLDADDTWLPNMLAAQAKQFSLGSKATHTSYYREVDGIIQSLVIAKTSNARIFDFWNPIGNLTGMYDKQALGLVLQEKIPHEDYLMWREIAQRAGKIEAIEEPLAKYSVAPGSLSGNKTKAAKWHWNLLRVGFKLNLLYSSFAFSIYAIRSVFSRIAEKLGRSQIKQSLQTR
jgi:teichuronic acid biosynthesis glycosyltransferase TuaG